LKNCSKIKFNFWFGISYKILVINDYFGGDEDKHESQFLNTSEGYQQAQKLAREHYENFPVVSFFLPKEIRNDVAIIYWFARTADDFADEGTGGPQERISLLNFFESRLESLLNSEFNNSLELALFSTINNKKLTKTYFFDLLSAFKQDVNKKKYANFDEILDYCTRSANPVGRLILELNGIKNDDANRYSDKICTALQLTNFYQDTIIDFQKGRIYYSQDEMEKFEVDEKVFELRENNHNFQQLLKHNVDRAHIMFDEGKKIFNYLDGKLKLQIKWTVKGGEEILKKIRKEDYNVLSKRPELSKLEMIKLFFAFVK
jgi:squalene synthase HpnC